MLTPNSEWTVRGATFALWALAAGSAVFWGLHFGGGQRTLDMPAPPPRQVAAVDPAALARLLGGAPAGVTAAAPQPTLASRFHLIGVAAGVESGEGAAAISVDGKPARPYRVGASIEEGVVLQSVHGRQATLADANGQTLAVLEVPALPPPVNSPSATPPAYVPPPPPPPGVPSRGAPPNLSPRSAQPNVPPQMPMAAPR